MWLSTRILYQQIENKFAKKKNLGNSTFVTSDKNITQHNGSSLNKIDEETKDSVKSQFSKNNTIVSDVESKRAKFFEKMTGLIKTQSQDVAAGSSNHLSKTMKPTNTETKNFNNLVKNLESHKGGANGKDYHEPKQESYENMILDKPSTNINKRKITKPNFV